MNVPARNRNGASMSSRLLTRAGSAGISVGLLVMLLVFTSCSPKTVKSTRGPAGVPVNVANAIARDVPVEIQAIGTVQAYSMVMVRPQITGPIVKVHFQEGEEVKEGALLFSL